MLRTSQQTRYLMHAVSSHVYAGHCQQKEYLTYAMSVAHASCYTMWEYAAPPHHLLYPGIAPSHTTVIFGKTYLRAVSLATDQICMASTLALPVSVLDNLYDVGALLA